MALKSSDNVDLEQLKMANREKHIQQVKVSIFFFLHSKAKDSLYAFFVVHFNMSHAIDEFVLISEQKK